jgi:putative transcriptional regulator
VSTSTLQSSLLVAMPQLQDPNFRRAVVLLVHHDEEGTFGLVLNRPGDLPVSELCEGIECRWRGGSNETVFSGGPVQTNTGWVLFEAGQHVVELLEDEVTSVGDGLAFAGSLEVLRAVAESAPPDTRLFLGYAGWGPGQLETELAEGAWLVAPLSRDAIFDVDPDAMWDHVLHELGIDPATLVATRGVH